MEMARTNRELGQVDLSTPLLSTGSTFLGNDRFRTPKMVAMETLSYCISQDWARGALPSLRTNRTEPRFVWVKKSNCFKASFISGKMSSFFLKDKTWQDHLLASFLLSAYYPLHPSFIHILFNLIFLVYPLYPSIISTYIHYICPPFFWSPGPIFWLPGWTTVSRPGHRLGRSANQTSSFGRLALRMGKSWGKAIFNAHSMV